MRNKDIIYLANTGVTHITTHSLGAEAAYKVYRFKRELKKLRQDIIDQNAEFIEELEIGSPQEFDRRRLELEGISERNEEQERELAGMNEKLDRFFSMRKQMLETDVEMKGFGRISYEDWKALQDENKSGDLDPLSGDAEELLEGVLWDLPEW